MTITIKDLAEMARVSTGTVSRVINGGPGVGEETRKRILKLIKELDYQPNASAHGLAAKRSGNIGVIIPHTGGYSMATAYWPGLLTAITERAAAQNYNVLLSTARSEEDVASAYQSILKGRRIDGLIIGAEQFGDKQLAELLLKDFPFVMVGKSVSISHYYVDVDNAGGARRMTEHLIGLGHRRIAMLAGPEHYPSVIARVGGFRQAMAAAGLDPGLVYHCPYWTLRAGEISREIIRSGIGVTAIFAAAGDLVTGVLQAAREEGLRLPEDLGVATFDDHPLYNYFAPAISAVRQPIAALGEAAAVQLFRLMHGEIPEEKGIVLPTELVIRASCGRPGLKTEAGRVAPETTS
ncbi:LacI family transcriptional regulator [Hydrogenispora ethanolica]|uniref:LacI family transcriptional regulator n=1 Tax=Hydrogenispora ethanolica TaxID=1082276 RepID=A0A4R1S2C0_HYDET|nr:LacI family DNA-binding transcriptional regulator [Hydrogenispora ethanolica]TCL73328.1 LacI family transcriptional regulator [Hydrogenispora ethanolica]